MNTVVDISEHTRAGYNHVWVGIGLSPGWNTASVLKIDNLSIRHFNWRDWNGADRLYAHMILYAAYHNQQLPA